MTSKIVGTARRAACVGLAAGLAWLAGEQSASAQEILLTGPLAGAPAVRKLKLYRQGRFEIAPAVSFTLLDEYQREIFFGARLNYNLTDWLSLGVWGAYGGVKMPAKLAEDIQAVNIQRRAVNDTQFTAKNIGPDFKKQLGTMDWVVAPQVTVVPFRGKIALFQSIYADSDLYFFLGPAFVGLKERAACGAPGQAICTSDASYEMASRMGITATFGLGFSFYANKWMALGVEWRGLPLARNTGGFDNRGAGPNTDFPDGKVDDKDREFKFNQMITVSWGFYFPQNYRVSE